MKFDDLNNEEIMAQYPFTNLDPKIVGIRARDNGVMNVAKILITLRDLWVSMLLKVRLS